MLCRRLLREASSSSVYEGLPTWNLTAANRANEAGVRARRYSIRYPFAADVEMLELESGSRARGVTSDLSLGGCFVCARCTLEIQAGVRGTLMHENKKVKMLAVVRVVIPQVGMGVESSSSSMAAALSFKFILPCVCNPYGEPVTSFGDPEQKRLDVARCGSI